MTVLDPVMLHLAGELCYKIRCLPETENCGALMCPMSFCSARTRC